MALILEAFPGREMPPEIQGDWASWGITGASFRYSRNLAAFRLSMGTYIDVIFGKLYDPKYLKKPAKIPLSPPIANSLGEEGPGGKTNLETKDRAALEQYIKNPKRSNRQSHIG